VFGGTLMYIGHVICWLVASMLTSRDNNTKTRSGPRKRRFMEKDDDVDYSNLLGYQVMNELSVSADDDHRSLCTEC